MVPAWVTLMVNEAPGLSVEEEVNFGPLTQVTLCGGLSSLVNTIVSPTLALIEAGEKARFFITTFTVARVGEPATGPVEGPAAAVADVLGPVVLVAVVVDVRAMVVDELDPQAASASAAAGTASSERAFMRAAYPGRVVNRTHAATTLASVCPVTPNGIRSSTRRRSSTPAAASTSPSWPAPSRWPPARAAVTRMGTRRWRWPSRR